MKKDDTKKPHWNLYYILQQDREENPIPPLFLQQLRKKLAEMMNTQTKDS